MHLEDRSWMDIEQFAKSHDHSWTYIILGRNGPTGKTYLCNKLKQSGYNAMELTESLGDIVDYRDDKNHYKVDILNKCVFIVLNKLRPDYTKCRVNDNATHCYECIHCFRNRRSKTGYSCEVWGHGDFASDTSLDGFCHKAKRSQTLDSLDGIHMFKTEDEANAILSMMNQIVELYGVVTEGDFMDMIDLKSSMDNHRHGWFGNALNDARIVRTSLGYFIEFPRSVPLS